MEEQGRLVVREKLLVKARLERRRFRARDRVPAEKVERRKHLAELVPPRRKVGVVELARRVEREFERVDNVNVAALLGAEEAADDSDGGIARVERLARVVVRDVEERERMTAMNDDLSTEGRTRTQGAATIDLQGHLESFFGSHGRAMMASRGTVTL